MSFWSCSDGPKGNHILTDIVLSSEYAPSSLSFALLGYEAFTLSTCGCLEGVWWWEGESIDRVTIGRRDIWALTPWGCLMRENKAVSCTVVLLIAGVCVCGCGCVCLLGDRTWCDAGRQQVCPGRAVPGRGFGRAAIYIGGKGKYFLPPLFLSHLPHLNKVGELEGDYLPAGEV